MARWLVPLGLTAAAVVVAGCVTLSIGATVWRRQTARTVGTLLETTLARAPATGQPLELPADLPEPVRRYLAFALPDESLSMRTARVRWTGEFRMRPDGRWNPFHAEQYFTVSPPGFVWDARIRMIPFVSALVRDSYAGGQAGMLGRVAGLVTVVDARTSAEMSASALARWLGEAVWFPVALVRRSIGDNSLRWTPIDDSTARATLIDGGITVSADFHFATSGEITRMTAMRYREVNGTFISTPFEGRYHAYERRGDVMIPAAGEAAWLLPEARYAYWRGRATQLTIPAPPP